MSIQDYNQIQFSEIKEHLSKIDEVLIDIKLILQEQHQSLNEHIRRTDIAEERLLLLEKRDIRIDGGIQTLKIIASVIATVGVVVGIWLGLTRR